MRRTMSLLLYAERTTLCRPNFLAANLPRRLLVSTSVFAVLYANKTDTMCLEQSTAAISSLSESYSGLDTLLASSRSLASSLLRSQKSDTWYLETAFYVLTATITWLLFRRILYGPMWWLIWLPFKFAMKFVFAALGAVGLAKGSTELVSSQAASDISATIQQTAAAVTGGSVPTGSAYWEDKPSAEDEDRLIDQIGKMVDEGKLEGFNIDDIPREERQREAELPRNTKKRMFEAEPVRDEL